MIIDYLTFTFQDDKGDRMGLLAKKLDSRPMEIDSRGGYNRNVLLLGTGRLQWDHLGKDSARLSLPGGFLSLYREMGNDVRGIVDLVLSSGGVCTRIDLAFDWLIDATPVIDRVVDALREGLYTSRWKLEMRRSCLRTKSVLTAGDTLYLGSPQSDCRMVFYDKAAERGEDEPRLRCELRVRKERAQAIAARIVSEPDGDHVSFIKSLVLGYIDVKQHGSDSNKSRWDTATWWKELWNDQKGRLEVGGVITSEGSCREWFERLGPTMAMFIRLDGNKNYLEEVANEGGLPIALGGRWRNQHTAKLRAWRAARVACRDEFDDSE